LSEVCFIAVSYFGSPDLPAYVDSFLAQSDPRWQLKIVDNSQDSSEHERLQLIAAADPRIEVWATNDNLGYFGAAEWARQRIEASSFEWICVTNTDVVLDGGDFIRSLMLLSGSDISILAPSIYGSRSRTALNPYMYSRPTVWRSRIRRLLFWNTATAQTTILISHLRRKIGKSVPVPASGVDIYAAHGCFMIFGTKFFTAGGNFRHSSFLFGEELTVAEFCRMNGLRTTYVPSLMVKHTEHANTGILRSPVVLRSQVTAARNALALISEKSVVAKNR
jgi:GT2 family glycosyltransferase